MHLLPVVSERNSIGTFFCIHFILFFKNIQKSGCFRFQLCHGWRKRFLLITISTNRKRNGTERFHSFAVYCYGFGCCGIIGDLNSPADQGGFCFVAASLETDARTFINLSYFMIKECFSDDIRIDKGQWPYIAVKLLERRDPFFGDSNTMAEIILPDPVMRSVAIVFLQIDFPVIIQILQCLDLFCFTFCNEIINYLMKFFNLSFVM